METPVGIGPLIYGDKAACRECWSCVRYCPARATRIVEGHREIIRGKCGAGGLGRAEGGSDGRRVRAVNDGRHVYEPPV